MGRLRFHAFMLRDLLRKCPEQRCARRFLCTVDSQKKHTLSRAYGSRPTGAAYESSLQLHPQPSSVQQVVLQRGLSTAADVEAHLEQPESDSGPLSEERLETSAATLDEIATSETTADETGTVSGEAASKKKRVWKEKVPAEVALKNFFERMGVIEQVVGLLKKRAWGEELQKSLRGLLVTHGTQVIPEVLRADLSCDTVLSFFKWLKSMEGFKHSENTYAVMLNVLGMAGRLDEMKELLTEMKLDGCLMTAVTTSNIMLWLSRGQDAKAVKGHWQRVKRSGTTPSMGIYNAYLDMLARTQDHVTLRGTYENMLSEKCIPNARTYTLFIEHLVYAGKLEAALQILKIMQKLHVVPSRVTFELIISGYARSGNLDMVQELLTEMRERFHKPSKRLLPAVKALQKAGKTDEALFLFRDIFPSSQAENVNEIGGLDDDPLKNEDVVDIADGEDMSDSFMGEWRSATQSQVGFDINGFAHAFHSWNPLVEEALEKANVEWNSTLILEILRRLRSLSTSWPFFHWVKCRPGVKLDSYCCMQMVQRVLKSEAPVEKKGSLIEDLFEELEKDGLQFPAPIFNMVIRHYVGAGELGKAVDMFGTMKRFNVQPNKASYTPVIQAYAKDRQGRRAMEMVEQMKQAGFQVDSSTRAELITCLALADKLHLADELFHKVSESGRSPDRLEYKALIASYYRAGDQKMALKLYEEMRGAEIPVTQDMYEIVSAILRKANRKADLGAIEKHRATLKFFDGSKKQYQEDLLEVLHLFAKNMKPRKVVSVPSV